MKTIEIKYFTNITPLAQAPGRDWIDLRATEDMEMNRGDFKHIPLGVAMRLPAGYEAHIVPRSTTLKHYGILQTNGMGIIDNSYSGPNNQWMFRLSPYVIPSSTRMTASASFVS